MGSPKGKALSGGCKDPEILNQDQELCDEYQRRVEKLGNIQELQTNFSRRHHPGSFMLTIRAAYSDNIQERLNGQVPLMTTIAEICNCCREDAVCRKKKLSNFQLM